MKYGDKSIQKDNSHMQNTREFFYSAEQAITIKALMKNKRLKIIHCEKIRNQ